MNAAHVITVVKRRQ